MKALLFEGSYREGNHGALGLPGVALARCCSPGIVLSMGIERFARDAKRDDLLAALERDGGIIVEGMVPEQTLSPMREAILRRAAEIKPGDATQGLPSSPFVEDF